MTIALVLGPGDIFVGYVVYPSAEALAQAQPWDPRTRFVPLPPGQRVAVEAMGPSDGATHLRGGRWKVVADE